MKKVVTQEALDKLESARQHLQDAIKELHELQDGDTLGLQNDTRYHLWRAMLAVHPIEKKVAKLQQKVLNQKA